jgi:hypothetical protein
MKLKRYHQAEWRGHAVDAFKTRFALTRGLYVGPSSVKRWRRRFGKYRTFNTPTASFLLLKQSENV